MSNLENNIGGMECLVNDEKIRNVNQKELAKIIHGAEASTINPDKDNQSMTTILAENKAKIKHTTQNIKTTKTKIPVKRTIPNDENSIDIKTETEFSRVFDDMRNMEKNDISSIDSVNDDFIDDYDETVTREKVTHNNNRSKASIKRLLLARLNRFNKANHYTSNKHKYSMKDKLSFLQDEIKIIQYDIQLQQKVSFYKIIFWIVAWGTEKTVWFVYGRKKNHPLKDWASHITNNPGDINLHLSNLVDSNNVEFDIDENGDIIKSDKKSTGLDRLFQTPMSAMMTEYFKSMAMYMFASNIGNYSQVGSDVEPGFPNQNDFDNL